MFPYIYTTEYSAGFRGRNTWLSFEQDLAQLEALRERVTREMRAMGMALPEDEWQLLLALRRFVHTKLPHDGWKAAERVDGFTLLDQAGTGAAYRCVEHGVLLCQIYQAFGIPARVLGLRLITPNFGVAAGHVLAEAWWTAGNRWVVMDSQFDAHWEHAGRPLGGDELQQMVLTGRVAELRWRFADESSRAEAEAPTGHWAGYFARISCGTAMDFLTHPARSERADRVPVAFLAPQVVPQFQFQGMTDGARLEPDPSLFWFPCNQVAVHIPQAKLLPEGKLLLELELEHSAPWFDRFELEGTGIIQQDGSRATWILDEGSHYLTVQTVNAMGRKGRPSRLGFLFFPEESMAKVEALMRQEE